jgi:hypothetical protein
MFDHREHVLRPGLVHRITVMPGYKGAQRHGSSPEPPLAIQWVPVLPDLCQWI